MKPLTSISRIPVSFAVLAAALPVGVSAQQLEPAAYDQDIVVLGERMLPDETAPQGPEVKGIISARNGDRVQVTSADGAQTMLTITENTVIEASGGFLGLDRDTLSANSLLNGLPVTVETVEWNGGLFASEIKAKNKDLRTANMIRNGTDQRFGEQGAAITKNAAATEALRGRFGDIDQYNLKGTTNVYFDTGKYNLSAQARNELCSAASQAGAMDNALLLVVGYTDSTGSYETNQELSEKRAGRVVNYLQQQCGWKPYRMLTPTGMAEADPAASNDTAAGKAQNRRVAVNILVSKSVDGI
ncbi:OmpA family protein [Pontixanthobacter aestiaquae]|nr:OmpA family protein [Pontixanthobacter aestiaquae]MDN3644856.1 OmpA family protein [Pontixanthobacter aestiaquae]